MQNSSSKQVSAVVPERNGSRTHEAEAETTEIPEIFEMPSVPTVRVWAKVRHVGPAPFVFVDELADDTTDQE